MWGSCLISSKLSFRYFESESSVLESDDDEFMFFLQNPSLSTNPSSVENKQLEYTPFVRINLSRCLNNTLHRLLQMQTTMATSPIPILGTQSGIVSSEHIPLNDDIHSDLDQHIALLKGKRSCISRSLYNFIPYSHLSSLFRSFVSSLDFHYIP